MKTLNYDVFMHVMEGNEREGYSYKDLIQVMSNIRMPEKIFDDNNKIIKFLKKEGILKKGIHSKGILIEMNTEKSLFFTDIRKSTGFKPLFNLLRKNQ